MNHISTAGPDVFIMFIIGAFWVIAQIAGAAAKKKQARPLSSDDDDLRTNPPDPFADLMRTLASKQEFQQTTAPEFTETPEPEELIEPYRPWEKTAVADMPAPALRVAPPVPPIPLRMPLEPPVVPHTPPEPTPPPSKESPIDLGGIHISPSMTAFRNSLPAMRLPTLRQHFQRMETAGTSTPILQSLINPSDPKTLRRAMLSHIIFSPPKALEKGIN